MKNGGGARVKEEFIEFQELIKTHIRAKKFYTLLKELQPDDTITVVFDLMQNQALPKLLI